MKTLILVLMALVLDPVYALASELPLEGVYAGEGRFQAGEPNCGLKVIERGEHILEVMTVQSPLVAKNGFDQRCSTTRSDAYSCKSLSDDDVVTACAKISIFGRRNLLIPHRQTSFHVIDLHSNHSVHYTLVH